MHVFHHCFARYCIPASLSLSGQIGEKIIWSLAAIVVVLVDVVVIVAVVVLVVVVVSNGDPPCEKIIYVCRWYNHRGDYKITLSWDDQNISRLRPLWQAGDKFQRIICDFLDLKLFFTWSIDWLGEKMVLLLFPVFTFRIGNQFCFC